MRSHEAIKERNETIRSIILSRPELGILVGAVALIVVFTILNPFFLAPSTVAGILSIASELGVITIGVALLMISGEFNLAVSSIYVLAPVLAVILVNNGTSTPVAFLTSLLIAACIGGIIGVTVVKTQLHSFIVSLGFMMLLRGVTLFITGGFPQEYQGDPHYLYILNGRIVGDFRTSAFWFVGVLLLFTVLLEYTRYGNWCFAAGGNPLVAHRVGVSVGKVKILNFVISSVLAGFAGFFSMSRLGLVDPSWGYGLELEAIAAAVVGGCSLFGGYGSIIGAAIGAITLSMFRVGLVLAGAPPYWYKAFVGPILIAATIVNYRMMRRVLTRRK